jgi:adenosylhomocysteinase
LYGSSVQHILALSWAEVVLRRYARITNRLVAARPFAVIGSDERANALRSALSAIGAHLVDSDATPGPDAVFAAGGDLDSAVVIDPAPTRQTAAARIDWAAAHMPVVAELSRELADGGRLDGLRVGLCLVLEPKTAVLALALAGAGAKVSLFGHPEETDLEVVAELRRRGLVVYTDPDPQRQSAAIDSFLDQNLNVLIDDGSRVIRALAGRPLAADFIGAAEETTSGLRPLREFSPPLGFPVVAVNDAGSKRYFDNAHGTGQSCLFTILDLLDPDERGWGLAGRTVAVAGFGPVGEGFARHARALGARVVVADPDPVARLRARFAGYGTGELVGLAADADLIVSASGYAHTIDLAVLLAAKEQAAVAVAGGVADEVDLAAALASGARLVASADRVEEVQFADGHSVRLLDRGGCINCTAGEGNPIEIMDLSFGVQLAAVETLLTSRLAPGVQLLPERADRRVAELQLASAGGETA